MDEATEVVSFIISTSGKVLDSSVDLLRMLICALSNFQKSQANGNKKNETLRKKGSNWLKAKVPNMGTSGQVTLGELNRQYGDNMTVHIDREDLKQFTSELKKRGVAFHPIKTPTGWDLVYKASNVAQVEAATRVLAELMNITKEEYKELTDKKSYAFPKVESDKKIEKSEVEGRGFAEQMELEGKDLKQLKAASDDFLLPAPEIVKIGTLEWGKYYNARIQTTEYKTEYKSYDLIANQYGEYKVSQMGKEISSGRDTYGNFKAAMVEAECAARSHEKRNELEKGVYITVGSKKNELTTKSQKQALSPAAKRSEAERKAAEKNKQSEKRTPSTTKTKK